MAYQPDVLSGHAPGGLPVCPSLRRRLGRWHLLLLALPLLNLPLGVSATPAPEAPLLTLLGILLVHFALPFAVLATTAVVAQSWLARSKIGGQTEPYPLYAASNAGSLLALLGYAFLAEPLLGVHTMSLAWTVGYFAYAALVVAAWHTLRPDPEARLLPAGQVSGVAEPPPQFSDYTLWLLLSCLPSVFLSTVTNFIALEIGSFPMVWVIPLALYLTSFVITFRSKAGIRRRLVLLWPEAVLFGFLVYLLPMKWIGWFGAVVAPLLVLFMTCLVANQELYDRRPPVQYLTNFYLTMALGGFLGGAAISLAAPLVFTGLYEYPLTLAALAVVFGWCHRRLLPTLWRNYSRAVGFSRAAIISVVLGLVIVSGIMQFQYLETVCKFRHRNFYGIMRVFDESPREGEPAGIRNLVHGKTNHGSQMLDPKQRHTPTSYYYVGGPLADAYASAPSPRRIAVVGLGAGVVSAYTGPEDTLTYYEIDPDNERIARSWFTYLGDSKGAVKVIVGDGRLSLMGRGLDHFKYNLIYVDAFTGDGIPTHLLTKEAMGVYLARLTADGIILCHISNRYYDLRPVVKSTGNLLGLHGVMNIRPPKGSLGFYQHPSQCVALARHPSRLQPLLDRGWIGLGNGDGVQNATPWTDDYINILGPLLAKLQGG